jgi:phage-related protein (TIGR01555 family)
MGRSRRARRQAAPGQATEARADGWENGLTELGTVNDKTTHGVFYSSGVLSLETLSDLYHFSDVARRVVESVPEETWRRGVTVELEGEEDASYRLQSAIEALDTVGKLQEAHIGGRRDGLGAVLLGAEDGQKLEAPLIVERVRKFEWLRGIEARELWPQTYYQDGGNAGEPETYLYTPLFGATSSIVHESRLICFNGVRTTKLARIQNSGRNHSVLQPMHDVLRQFDVGWKAVEHLLTDGYQTVIKMAGLAAQIGAQGQAKVEMRMRLIDRQRSVGRPILLDAGNPQTGQEAESFERTSVSFEQVPAILEKFMLRMASAAKMPVSKLMGQAPAGLNATGASDIRFWYDEIDAERTRDHSKNIKRIVELVIAAERMSVDVEDVTIAWPSLWQESRSEKEAASKVRSDRLVNEVNAGILMAEEVTLSEYGGKEADVQLSEESLQARRDALAMGLAAKDANSDNADDADQVRGVGESENQSENPEQSSQANGEPEGKPGSPGRVSDSDA